MSGEGTNLEPRVSMLESDVRRHGDRFEKMMERSDRQFESMRQEFLAETKALHGEIRGIHSELKNIRDSIASMRVWAVTFGFGLAAGILSVMAQAFGWLH